MNKETLYDPSLPLFVETKRLYTAYSNTSPFSIFDLGKITQEASMIDRDRIGAMAAKQGLIAIKKGYRLNSSYTPKNCRFWAEKVSGKTFRPRDYDGMIEALETYLNVT